MGNTAERSKKEARLQELRKDRSLITHEIDKLELKNPLSRDNEYLKELEGESADLQTAAWHKWQEIEELKKGTSSNV
jgi:hypothetical protein